MAALEPPPRNMSGVRFTPGGVAIPVALGGAEAIPSSAPLPQHIRAHGQPGERAGSITIPAEPRPASGPYGAARLLFTSHLAIYPAYAGAPTAHAPGTVTALQRYPLSWCTGDGQVAAEGAGEAADAEAAPWWQALTLSELLGQHARVSCHRPWLVRGARLPVAWLCLWGLSAKGCLASRLRAVLSIPTATATVWTLKSSAIPVAQYFVIPKRTAMWRSKEQGIAVTEASPAHPPGRLRQVLAFGAAVLALVLGIVFGTHTFHLTDTPTGSEWRLPHGELVRRMSL